MTESILKGLPVKETKTQRPQKVIVEIGPGHLPLYRLSPNMLSENDIYVGIDSTVMGDPLRHQTGGEIIGDLKALPLQSESANEVWLLNVFGYFFANSLFHRPDLYGAFDSRPVFLTPWMTDIFIELTRVLKFGGKIYIGEYYTPPHFLPRIDFNGLGLNKKVFIGPTMNNFITRHRLDAIKKKWSDSLIEGPTHKPFFLSLTKKRPTLS